MLKIDCEKIFNFKNALVGCRHPLESYDRIDSEFDKNDNLITLGKNDLALMKKLIKAGSDHRKFLRQILVSVDVKAPLYWWKEADTYKVGTTVNSTSTMHSIHKKGIDKSLFSFDRDGFNTGDIELIEGFVGYLENLRIMYNETGQRKYWRMLIQLLPSSFNQTRMMTMNYEVLLNMYHSRKAHKLTEWHTFCDWVENLPYFKELCLGLKDE